MTIDEQIEDLQYQIKRIDGHTKTGNVCNRTHGLFGIGVGTMFYYIGSELNFPINIAPYLIETGFIMDGIGSLATGKLHYVLFRAIKVHPKYELERLEKQKENN